MGKQTQKHTDEVRTILDAAPFPLLISRVSDGTVLYANENVAAYAGLKADELIGKKTPDFYANAAERQTLLEEVKEKGRVNNFELHLRDTKGRERWSLASVVATTLRGEAVLVAGLNDITERKAAEEELRRSEERFRRVIENANDIIYLLTPDGNFTYVSPNWTDVLGHDVAEVVGKNFAPFVHVDDLDECYVFLNTVLETGEKQSGIEYRVKHKDGHWRWHTSNASCLKDDDGKVISFIGIARDITEKKQAQLDLECAHRELREKEAQLISSERMAALGKLVGGVAHEINSPIGAIQSMHDTLSTAVAKLQKYCAERASERKPDPAFDAMLGAIIEANNVIGQGTERISQLVSSLRLFTRLDEADLKECDIHEGIDSTLTLIDHEIKGRVEVLKEYGKVGRIVCYPRRLNQVFLNVLLNAAQAIDGSGKITISTREVGSEVHIAVRDTGRGIAKEHLEGIFEPTFTNKGGRMGTRLGLSICSHIMRQHKGRIEVESELGKGSVFTIAFPRDLRAEPLTRSA